jgi:predicted nuclease of restriction endonuclease-like (RecB) superfamily
MELQQQFTHISQLIAQAKTRAYKAVNTELVNLYWHIGEYVSEQVQANVWGKSIVQQLADFIQKTEPNVKGFSSQNIWRMKQFYETYKDNEKLSALLREIPWTSNVLIFTYCKTEQEREFYLRLILKERLTSRELERQINSSYFERVMIGNTKLATVGRVLSQEIKDTFKDTYVLELLHLPEPFLEKDLRKAISQNITKFLLEFGRDFAFMGEEYPLQVYNRNLNCMVAIELKIENFKPDHLGQLNFYLEALDRDIKKPHENPSIGILLCKGKDDMVVEYAMSRNLSPTLVADYQTKLPNKALLQAKWEEIINQFDSDDSK